MSLKLKIALYNTLLVGIIVALVLAFMMSNSDFAIESTTKNQLMNTVHENAEEVEWDDGELELDDIKFYSNHITTLVYSHDGYLLEGYISNLEDFIQPLLDGEVTNVDIDGVNYLIYDYFVSSNRYDGVYIRGIVSSVEAFDIVRLLFSITVIALPVFILLAGIGSYIISKKSMKPLDKIVDTAHEISNGDELSRRIDLGVGNDEIHNLANTFDDMFAKLEQAFLSEKQFSSDVSHELRTPIAVILAECECNLKDEICEQDRIEALKTIQSQGKKMQHLITALLNLIRLDNGVYKMNIEAVDISELIAIVCEEQETLLPSDRKLITDLQEQLICNIDYSMIIRVISNLIDNGIKYGKNNGFVKISLKDQGETVLVTVEDNGIGIQNEHLEKIFNRFYQVDTARTSDTSNSMGLGLSMVAQIIKLHNGTINVESEKNVGSKFFITLPKNI